MSKIVLEDFNEGDGYYKVNLAYLNKEQVEEIEDLVSKWKPTDEDIKDCIRMCLTDANEQRFNAYETTFEDCLAWLEKHGEQKPAKNIVEIWKDMRLEVYQQASGNRHEPNYSDDTTKMFSLNDIDEIFEKISEQKLADKVESTFKVGYWIVNNNTKDVFLIKSINNGYCTLEDIKGNIISPCLPPCESESHIWSIQDAKDGDVLVASDGSLFIFAKVKDNSVYYHFSLCKNGSQEISDGNHAWETANSCHPATKEQRDCLFQEIRKAGYEWDAENKELKKFHIIDEGKDEMDYCFTKMMNGEKVSSAWSEEEYDEEDYGIDALWHAQRILEKTLGKVDGYQSDDGILEHKCAISAVKKLYEQKQQ